MTQPVNVIETEPMRHNRKSILRLVETINRCSSLLAGLQAEIEQVGEELRALARQHPEFAQPNQRNSAAYATYRMMLPCTYLIDVFLIGGLAEFCARVLFPHWPFIPTIARFLIPLAVLGVEQNIAAQRHAAKVEAEEAPPGTPRFYAVVWWTVMGVLWAAAAPAVVSFTQHAAAASKLATSTILVHVGPLLMVMAFLLHLAILFAGQLGHDGKGHIAYWLKCRKLGRQTSKASRGASTGRHIFRSACVRYSHELNRHNQSYPYQRIAAGPFSADTKHLVLEVFGDDFLVGLDTAAMSPESSRPIYPLRSISVTEFETSQSDQSGPERTHSA